NAVPVGEDQLPHIELTREIARRFNHIYKTDFFTDCEAILTKTPRLLGLDGRKMSKSYQNAINLSDTEEAIRKKVKNMFTDPKRVKRSDPGHPDECNLFNYYEVFAPERAKEVRHWCTKAEKGCTDCKMILADVLVEYLKPIREKRSKFEKNHDHIRDVLEDGRKKAQNIAQKTIAEIKEVIF
ncbi:MAG TPA: tryptophan--tRNA ligase, partial [Candidatus Omnitrophota bacterium]|nr:tryptophan--tRNA ligase [Candidatus Omnitrophota bacterium]